MPRRHQTAPEDAGEHTDASIRGREPADTRGHAPESEFFFPPPITADPVLWPTVSASPPPGHPHAALPDAALATDRAALPERFDDYQVLRLIGAGAMGKVYLARDTELERLVAIKVVSTPSPVRHELMRGEAQAAAAIQHPNVVTIHRVGTLDGRPYIVTEYIRGTGLDAVDKPLPWERALAIGLDLARGLAAAHRHGVLHRDIKPANVILAEGGQAKLIDFGLAVRTDRDAAQEQAPAGTPSYMAPELWQGELASQRTDVYAMGVLLYELCAGRVPRPPLASESYETPALESLVSGIDPRFAALVHRCLASVPEERPASGDALRDALEALQAPESSHALPQGNPYRGLLPFEAAHRALFFGRSAEIRLVIERMRTQRFVLLAGESGVGKSSLAWAGVLPRVMEGALGEGRSWTLCRQVPGPRPLTLLVHALATHLDTDEDALASDIEHDDLPAVSRALRAHHGNDRGIVLFYDQLEELSTLADPDEAERTSRLLACLAERTPGVRILSTARADYLARLAALPGLGPLVERSLCIVRPLGAETIREVVVAPARATGVRFESEALVERLITSAARADGGLPLLQFALAQLWEQRDAGAGIITEAAFEAIGGAEGALARHAEGVLDAVLADTRQAMQHILLRLVTSNGMRTRLTAAELDTDKNHARYSAINALVAGRLVVAGDLEGEPVYEIAHEALISSWPTLRTWLDRENSTRIVHERLTAAARVWESAGRSSEYLWRRKQVAAAEAIDGAMLSTLERAFLSASGQAVRRVRWLQGLAGVAVLLLLFGTHGVYRVEMEGEIRTELDEAEKAGEEASARWQELTALHEETMQALRTAPPSDDTLPQWKQMLTMAPAVDAAYQQVSRHLERALHLAPDRESTHTLMSSLLDARARLADLMGRWHEREQLVGRLALFDSDAHERWSAPVPVVIRVRPGAAFTIKRHMRGSEDLRDNPHDAFDEGVSLARAWNESRPQIVGSHTPYQPPRTIALPPGSYVIEIPADGTYAELRYPFLVRPRMPAVDIDIARPLHTSVPKGFVYIPPGPFLSGFGQNGDLEPLRRFYGAHPLHERSTGAFVIARYESTFHDWMAFLDACWPHGCDGVIPSLPSAESGVTSTVAIALHRDVEHGWALELRPTKSHVYRAARGQPLTYQGRSTLEGQDWEKFPVIGVSWRDVQAYLQWLRASGRLPGARLCTADEWERAARGADDRMFPHGNELLPDDANFDLTYGRVEHAFGPDEVGSHPRSASPFGLHDMAGNVWELVDAEAGGPDASGDAVGGSAGEDRPLAPVYGGTPARAVSARGGSYFHQADNHAVVNIWSIMSDQKTSTVGFRVCADAPRL